MKKQIISTFREYPKTKIGWWAFGLSMISIAGGPILGITAAVVVPFLDRTWGEKAGQVLGFGSIIATLVIMIATLVLSITAFRKGERSCAVLLALGLSIASVCFWIFMIIGEFLFPH